MWDTNFLKTYSKSEKYLQKLGNIEHLCPFALIYLDKNKLEGGQSMGGSQLQIFMLTLTHLCLMDFRLLTIAPVHLNC